MALMPIFDLINHDYTKQNCWWDGSGKVFAMRQLQAGEELFFDYGATGNVQLLANYGFTTKNSEEPIQFTTSELIQACQTVYRQDKHFCESRVVTRNMDEEYKVMLSAKCVLEHEDLLRKDVYDELISSKSSVSNWTSREQNFV